MGTYTRLSEPEFWQIKALQFQGDIASEIRKKLLRSSGPVKLAMCAENYLKYKKLSLRYYRKEFSLLDITPICIDPKDFPPNLQTQEIARDPYKEAGMLFAELLKVVVEIVKA